MARYTELENKHIQLELDLKLVQENFTKAKEEEKGMFGENLDDWPYFFCPFLILTSLSLCRKTEGGSEEEGS